MRKIRFRIHPAGSLLLAAAFFLADTHAVLAAVLSLLLHESCHLAAMMACGMQRISLELTPFGGMADADSFDLYPAGKKVLAASAGVIGSALAAWICLRAAPRTLFWEAFFQCNLSLALLNALPAWPLDGARVLAAVGSLLGIERGMKRVLAGVAWTLGALICGLGLYGVWHGVVNPSLLVMGPYLCYASRMEGVSEKLRRLEQMHRKLGVNAYLPVKALACAAHVSREQMMRLLGCAQNGRTLCLLQLDPQTGAVQKCWTEGEMLRFVTQKETTDTAET